VLIIPYDTSLPQFYIQTVPNKLFQYIAAGRPVVTSNLPYLIELPRGIVYKAKDAPDFVNKIRLAYSEDSNKLIESRMKIAMKNTWDHRGNRLHEIIETGLKRKN
jgi:glycosyltransferase involved in cell wall biosynthesis